VRFFLSIPVSKGVLTCCVREVYGEGTGDLGATALAEALKENRMLKDLYYNCAPPCFLLLLRYDDSVRAADDIGDAGATAMGDMLRINRTLLYLQTEICMFPWQSGV
jgi:hypothetical protein